ncbi:MAG: hypothetical protein M5U22_04860 [Thermoleophilia bacterium]|nr:hypothetical protein [Thermoleophilia bacterium]
MERCDFLVTSVGVTRNDSVVPFPHVAEPDLLDELRERVIAQLRRGSAPGEWEIFPLESLSPVQRAYLAERGLMTPAFARARGEVASFGLYKGGLASLEINGQDHLRLLAAREGDHLSELWAMVDSIDDSLEQGMTFAFDERWGYLTARPDEAGTGLKAYAVVQTPALMVAGRVGVLALQLMTRGLLLTPLWDGAGGLFQVSNRGGRGISELFITEAVVEAARDLVEKERSVRKILLRDNPVRVRDHMGRALGVAQRAWVVGWAEAVSLISSVQVGVEMGLIDAPDLTPRYAFELMRRVQPGHLAVEEMGGVHGGLEDPRIDEVRARILRDVFVSARFER